MNPTKKKTFHASCITIYKQEKRKANQDKMISLFQLLFEDRCVALAVLTIFHRLSKGLQHMDRDHRDQPNVFIEQKEIIITIDKQS